MEPVRKIAHPRIVGPVDLQLILNPAVNYKVKLQLIQKLFEYIEECYRSQPYLDNMIIVLLKLLSVTEPSFLADHDVFKIRKLVLQIIHKVCSSNDKIKNHIQHTMRVCLKIIETDNEQCVIYCILIFKELLTTFKPKFDGVLNAEVGTFLKLIINMYNNSNTQDKILNFQKTSDIKTLVSKIRVTTTVTRNSVNYNFTPMGKISFKVIKELGHMLKLYYALFYGVQSFKNEIKEFLPILMNFFNLDIPYKSEYRDIVLDLKHAQVRLLFFFSIFLKDNKDVINLHFSTLPGRVITLLNCNLSSDVSNLRTELLSGFESLILIDYKYEFLPYMDKFLDESLITGRSWSLKSILRPKAYVYIDHLITHLHNQLSLNFLVRVIHLHFSNILDSILQPEVQINLCNMVMNVLSYIVHRQNQLITNINTVDHNKNPLTDLFYRIFHIFVIKLKQFQKFYLPQLDECSLAKENIQESISSILAENQSKEKRKEFVYGYHSSQIAPYTISDCRRFIKIIIPAIRTLFQFIVKIEGGKFAIEHHYKKLFKDFLKHSLLSLKIFDGSIKKEMVKEVLSALSCINSISLKTLISGDLIVNQIYYNSLETFFFDMALNDEVLATTFSCLIFEFILKHLTDETEKLHVLELADKLQSNFELNKNDKKAYEYVYKVIKMLMNILPNTRNPVFYINILKSLLMIVESAGYDLGDNVNSLLNCLFCDLLSYYHSLPDNLVVTKKELAELCLSECVFKVALHPQIMDLLPVIAYSLQVTELTPQGLGILEKCLDILPDFFFDNPVLQVRNNIIKGLYYCLDSPFESISLPAVNLLGKFGGLNRSSTIKSYNLNAKEQFYQKTKNPKIMISFENYNELLDVDFSQGVNTAVETLISNDDKFIRNQSWNVIKGFFTVSLDYDFDRFISLSSLFKWETFIHCFSHSELPYTKTIIDETYIKALTGLMICCSDDNLRGDARKYFNAFMEQIIYSSICYFSGIPCVYDLEVNPLILIDATIIALSNEKETISNFGLIASDLIVKEFISILSDSVIYFPSITYMFKKYCELCYDTSWICKRAGCIGLQVLFFNFLHEEIMAIKYCKWLTQNFLTAFRALLFTFSDSRGHLTFGSLKIAQINLNFILNGLYWTQKINESHNLIQETILKELIGHIVGPNDSLREQSIEIVNMMAKKQGKTVLDILEPFYEHLKLAIPGNQMFHAYTFKSQIGIMKGHIFCALHSISLEQLDHDYSNKIIKYYFYILSVICGGNNEDINKIKMFQSLTSDQLYEFHLCALQILGNSFNCLMGLEIVKIYGILLNSLRSSDSKIQEISYHCLKLHCNDTLLIDMVEKLLISNIASIEDHDKITIISIRHVLYLSKLYPSHPNTLFCTKLVNAFEFVWNDLNHCSNEVLKNELELILENILEIVSLITETQFCHVQELCEIILTEDISKIDLCNQLYPWLFECVLKYPTEFLALFFQEQNIKKPVWSSFFNSMIHCDKCESLRKVMTSDGSHLETLLLSSRIDPSRSIQHESIKIIYNLMKMDKKWIATKKMISILINIWSNPQYKERFKNLAAIKSTEWDEPKMLLKIVLAYYKENINEIFILFQVLPVFSYRFPVDINFFRRFLENEIVNSSINWKRMVFNKFIDLYNKKTVNGDILGKILQYLILPCFAVSYKNGEKEQLLCLHTKSDENIIGIILNKIFNNIRVVLTGCDFDGIKVFLCQLICMLIEDLLNFNENISTLIYNAIISCTSPRCTMDLNVKCHCYLILTFMMLSGNIPKDEKLKETIYNELLKASFAEAQPVIDYSLNLIIMTVYENNGEINTLVECIKKMMKNEFQSVPTLHRICSFVIRYNTLFYPFKQDLIRNLLGSLFPIAKNNNIPEFKKTAIELACMIIKWELTDENMKMKYSAKRSIDKEEIFEEIHNSSSKKSSEIIDNSLNFLAMVGCQTHDDKQESRISKLAVRSAKLFKNILTTEAIDTLEVKLKFGWIEKLLDTFLKKENIVKQNPNAHGNTNASVMNLLTTFDILSFMLNVLSPKLMLEAIKPLQDLLIRFLELAYNEEITFSYPQNQKDILLINQLAVSQYNEGTLKVITEILKTFTSNEGLEKLHLYIQMIISQGLRSNNPQQLEISLVLLKGSLINFANYMDEEILNTIGDIMFKFNENNGNPLIKVKCLEVLKIHIDTLPRSKKQLFIEKVVMENLDKARYLENNIPFEVQKKCFELVIIYIKDLSQATERVLLNSILLEYIKTTADERIMEIILDVIAKWIEICRNEAVLFNSQTISILKSTIIINRFPKLTEYCYKLNLEIFKNWKSIECIEYGINCKYPSIRYDFINFYDSLWSASGVCMRLYSIMNNDISYDVEFSIAFYIQFLFIKISKNTKIKGNFPLLKLSDPSDIELHPIHNILMNEVCSSLAQLCFVDVNLAKHLWISIIPNVWSLFSDTQRTLLSTRAVQFLTNSKLKNNFLSTLYEAIILCRPKINFEPHQMVYVGKTYNLWYIVTEQLENIYNCSDHDKNDEAIEGLIQMYSLLREEDVLEGLFQNTIKCEDTKKALSLENLGFFKHASNMYIDLYNHDLNVKTANRCNSYNVEHEFRNIHLTKCLRELNEWNYLSENILSENDLLLNIENTWKNSVENSTYENLKFNLEHKQKIWPTKLIWKYHFYLGMLGLNTLDENNMSSVQEHVEFSIKDIINKWKVLPKHLCDAHIPLLQATQLIVEVQEAYIIQKSWLQTPQNISNIDALVELWNKRKLWVGDNLNVWNDLALWRQTYYSFLNQDDLILKMDTIKSLQDQSKLLFGKIAIKQNMTDVCMKTLKSIDPSSASTPNWLHKMFLEAKCVQKAKKYNKLFNEIANSPLNEGFTVSMTPLLQAITGSFQGYYGNTVLAFKNFALAFLKKDRPQQSLANWRCIIRDNLNYYCSVNKETPSFNFATNLNKYEILVNAWIQWGTLIQNYFAQSCYKDMSLGVPALECFIIAITLTNNFKSNILIARILWLLTYDDDKCTLLHSFKKSNTMTFSDFWISQMLNVFVEKNISTIQQIFSKIGRMNPQKLYLTLNRMYLAEKKKTTTEMETCVNIKKNDDSLEETGIKKIDKIKLMMHLVKKYNLHFLQLDYFVDQIISLGENWVEELRRNIYECLNMSYEFAFEIKCSHTPIPPKILNFIETKIILFATQDTNTDHFRLKNTFLVPKDVSKHYQLFKEKFPLDFKFDSVSSIKVLIYRLKKWINYVEHNFNYTEKFVHEYRCSAIHKIDWSVINLPSDHYIDDSLRTVKIHNFSGNIYLKDKFGTTIKQLTILGTDGLLYTYNISVVKCIESEERIFQLFHMTNNYLLDFKETTKRFLKLSIPKTFTISPNLKMIETTGSDISLLEIYKEINNGKWIHEDIDFWFSVFHTSIMIEKPKPLLESLIMTSNKFGSGKVMENWVSLRYTLLSDYWTFRKTFIEHYSLICFFEYAYNLIKLKPEMLNVDKNNGAAVVIDFTFFFNKNNGNLVHDRITPFRLTQTLTNFITPFRKYQVINCLTATGLCLSNSMDEISVVLKLLLKDELAACYTFKNDQNLPIDKCKILELVHENLDSILKNLEKFKKVPAHNPIPDLVKQALQVELLCHESPAWRPWL